MKNIDEEEIKNLEKEKTAAEESHKEAVQLKGSIEYRKQTNKAEQDKLNKELADLSQNAEQISAITENISLIEELITRCKTLLDDTEKEAKFHIAQDVNRILEEFSRKSYEVKLSENFDFVMVDKAGKRVAKGSGESLLLNLSFVSALIKFCRQRVNASGDLLLGGTVAPFVVDAPFGELDDSYKRATAKFLPTNTDQLVLLLSSSHWMGTVEEEIRERVGREYVLISHTTDKKGPEDNIDLGGTTFQLSKYGADIEFTEILEV